MHRQFKKIASSLGPGLITAALVLGPGSITMVSKAGSSLGYKLIWVTLFSGILMGSFTVMSARIGTLSDISLLNIVKDKYGRCLSILMGIAAFIVCCCFQGGDNLGVSISLQAIFGDLFPEVNGTTMIKMWSAGFTLISIFIVMTATNLYKMIERIITILVLLMIACFIINLFPARPSLAGIGMGLIPSASLSDLALIIPIVATTFSVIAAMYQAYMVQSKGWKLEDFKKGITDSLIGIGILTFLSIVVMITAAAVLKPKGISVKSAGDMAVQLQPLLGRTAKYLFAIGLWGASFSSLIANALVGGGLLSDGLGLGWNLEGRSVKACTLLVMIAGALVTQFWAGHMLNLIIVAQRITIVFVPLCAVVILIISNNKTIMKEHTNTLTLNILGAAGFLTVTGLGCYQLYRVFGS